MLRRCYSCILLLFFITLAIAAPVLFAEDYEEKRVSVFLHANFSETRKRDIFRDVVTDALIAELKQVNFTLVPEEEWQEARRQEGIQDDDLVRGPVVLRLAKKLGADVAITGFVRIEDNEILFGIKCYDVAGEKLSLSILKEGPAGLQVYGLINDAAAELVPHIRELLRPPSVAEAAPEEKIIKEIVYRHETVEMGQKIQVTFLSENEGAEVYLAGQKYIGEIREGKLAFTAKANTRLILEVRKPGFHDSHHELSLKEEDEELKLPSLMPLARSGLELEYTSFQFLGAGAAYRRYLIPDKLYLRVEDYLYLSYPFINPGAKPVFHNDLEFQIGTYIFTPPASLFRFGLTTGVGLILTKMVVPTPLFMDLYWNILDFSLELNFKKLVFYLKTEVKYTIGIGNNLLGVGMIEGFGPLYSLGAIWKW